MFRTLSRLLGAVHDRPGTPPLEALALRIEQLERAEVERNAEVAAMVDRLDRLYKRITARIGREGHAARGEGTQGTLPLPGDRSPVLGHPEATESPLSLRQRLRGR